MTQAQNNRAIALWLFICCVAIFVMVVLGGVTRLTGSGLSMVDWKPVTRILPPTNQVEWTALFDLYKESPEYQKKNIGMDLEGFKSIFWLEYLHRLLGRLIGMIFLLPLVYFLFKRMVERSLAPKLVAMFFLGGLQGLLGWYMVKSGLVHDPHVSQYRLTAHLGFAFLLYAYLFWVALGLYFSGGEEAKAGSDVSLLRRLTIIITTVIFITVISGGFVAGLRAGMSYNTFPLMGGKLIPDGLFTLDPLMRNFFENVTTVQFDHRVLATLLFFSIIALWFMARRLELPKTARIGYHLLLAVLLIQVSLGIGTLLMRAPVHLAATHQGGALMLLTVALFASHRIRAAS